MRSINFELSSPLSYAGPNGVPIECNHIELREPTGKVSDTCCAIEGLIQSGMLGMANKLGDDVIAQGKEAAAAEPVEDGAEKAGDGMLAVMVGSGVDMKKIVLHFRELFVVVAWMGGEKQITKPRLDDMVHKDLRKMIGVYAANFIMN